MTTRTEGRPPGSAQRIRRLGTPVPITIVLLHALGIALLVLAAGGADGWYLMNLGVTAYLLGARHAFDADHIAAIDNATRRLSLDGRPSSTVGFWFSLGHSTVVLAAVGLLLAGVAALFDAVNDDTSALRQGFGYWGATVSLVFVIAFGCLNLVSLIRIARRRPDGTDPGGPPQITAAVSQMLRPISHLVDRPARMFLVGLLFGLGFDTAATIGVFVTAGAASMAVSWPAAIALPLLFTAGMSLFDSLDGAAMSRLYVWSSGSTGRRARYDVVITALSVLAAFVVAGIGLATLAGELTGASIDLPEQVDWLGFVIVAVFLVTWLLARVQRKTDERRA